MTDGPFLGLTKQSQQKRKTKRSPGPDLGLHRGEGLAPRRRSRAAAGSGRGSPRWPRGWPGRERVLELWNSSFILKSDPAQMEPRKD